MRLTGITPLTSAPARVPDVGTAEKVAAAASARATSADEGIGVATVFAASGRAAPFDSDRVAEIRKAIKEDRYPLVPAEIADALIAAKLYGSVGS